MEELLTPPDAKQIVFEEAGPTATLLTHKTGFFLYLMSEEQCCYSSLSLPLHMFLLQATKESYSCWNN